MNKNDIFLYKVQCLIARAMHLLVLHRLEFHPSATPIALLLNINHCLTETYVMNATSNNFLYLGNR